MHKKLLASAVLGLGLVLGGCFGTTFVNPDVRPGVEHDPWVNFFFLGLAGEADIDVRELCPGEVASVGVGQNAGTWVTSLLTLGIYTPRKVYVTCAADGPSRASAEIDLDTSGTPTRVTRAVGGRRLEGEPMAMGGGVYSVAFHEVKQ